MQETENPQLLIVTTGKVYTHSLWIRQPLPCYVAFIQDPKEGEHYAVERFRKPHERGTWKWFRLWTQGLIQCWGPFSVKWLLRESAKLTPLGYGKPHFSVVMPLEDHGGGSPQRITAWCAIWSKWVIGPIFIDSMVTRVKYWELLGHHFIPKAGPLDMISRYWFMLDGVRHHVMLMSSRGLKRRLVSVWLN